MRGRYGWDVPCHHPHPPKRYAVRRTAEGKSDREIRRCLKRTLARQLYRLLECQAAAAITA
jgi:transposase